MTVKIIQGDCRDVLRTLEPESVHCIVTSPPYFGLRDYGMDDQIGLEPTPAEFVAELVAVFRECRRVLRADGTLWLNLGDSYAGSANSGGVNGTVHTAAARSRLKGLPPKRGPCIKPKDLLGIPWQVAIALRDDGWYLRKDIIWHKPNSMPEPVTDRPASAHEYIFLFAKSPIYFFDANSVKEPAVTIAGKGGQLFGTPGGKAIQARDGVRLSGKKYLSDGTRIIRDVWAVNTQRYSESHFATMAPRIAETCIKAGCPKEGIVLDPFGGPGTTGVVADRLKRSAILIEINPDYVRMARKRLSQDRGFLSGGADL